MVCPWRIPLSTPRGREWNRKWVLRGRVTAAVEVWEEESCRELDPKIHHHLLLRRIPTLPAVVRRKGQRRRLLNAERGRICLSLVVKPFGSGSCWVSSPSAESSPPPIGIRLRCSGSHGFIGGRSSRPRSQSPLGSTRPSSRTHLSRS